LGFFAFNIDAPKCVFKGTQQVYGSIGEQIMLLCDMKAFPDQSINYEWKFHGKTGKKNQGLRSHITSDVEDKFHYAIPDEKAFGKITCTATNYVDDQSNNRPCVYEIVPKGKL
jgi:hypothetical protein